MSTAYQPRKVEDYLKEVDYSHDPDYVPSEFAIEFVNFIKLVNGEEGEENTTPVVHYKMLDTIDSDAKAIANMIFRGAAKTTLLGEYFILYLALYGKLPNFGKIDLAIYVSDSIDNGVKSMRKNLEYRWENSEFLKKYIPTLKFTDIRWQFNNIAGNTFVVKAYGAKTGIRGTKEMGKRPQVAILDDLVSDDDARSPTVLDSIKDTVHKAIKYAMHPKRRKVIWLGTPFSADDPLYEVIESGTWEVNVFPICEKYPCSREEFRGAWEDRFSYDYVQEMHSDALANGKVHAFYQELMLQIMSDDDRLILDSDLQWYSLANLMDKKGNFNFYITTDFATSEKTSADFSVISVWALNNKGYWFYVDGICKRQLLDVSIKDLFRLVQIYNPLSVGIEVTGQQQGFISWIKQEMMDKNVFFNLASSGNSNAPGIRPSNQKFTRFLSVLPWFKQKLMFFPEEMRNDPPMAEAMNELTLVAKGGFKAKHDDWIDTVSMLAMMDTWRPSASLELQYNDKSGLWEDVEDDLTSSLGSYIV